MRPTNGRKKVCLASVALPASDKAFVCKWCKRHDANVVDADPSQPRIALFHFNVRVGYATPLPDRS